MTSPDLSRAPPPPRGCGHDCTARPAGAGRHGLGTPRRPHGLEPATCPAPPARRRTARPCRSWPVRSTPRSPATSDVPATEQGHRHRRAVRHPGAGGPPRHRPGADRDLGRTVPGQDHHQPAQPVHHLRLHALGHRGHRAAHPVRPADRRGRPGGPGHPLRAAPAGPQQHHEDDVQPDPLAGPPRRPGHPVSRAVRRRRHQRRHLQRARRQPHRRGRQQGQLAQLRRAAAQADRDARGRKADVVGLQEFQRAAAVAVRHAGRRELGRLPASTKARPGELDHLPEVEVHPARGQDLRGALLRRHGSGRCPTSCCRTT